MFSVQHPSAYLAISGLLQAMYPLWAAMWGLVAIHYGRAAYASWLKAGRGWINAVPDFLGPLTWAFTDAFCKFRLFGWAPFSRWAVCNATIPTPYEPGHLLRFSIFLGSLSPMAFGIVYTTVDRTGWDTFQIVANVITVALSLVAAGGHLFLSYMNSPNNWRAVVLVSTLWLIVATPLFVVFNPFGTR